MKKSLTILFVLFFCLSFTEAYSQSKAKSDSAVIFIDKMPEFKGGIDALMRYMERNLKYPKNVDNSITGKVIVRFVVAKDGSIDKVEIVKSLHPELDREALYVVKRMPKWIPGEMRGKPISVQYTLPIFFGKKY